MLQHLFLHFSGFEGFTDFRCFHICRRNVTYQGITKEVGIVECKPDAASGNWGDTTGIPGTPFLKSWHLWCNLPFSNNIVPIMIWISGTFLPLMKDPHKVLDYDNWWKKSLGNIKDYVIPALSDDIVKKLHVGLDASAERIWRTRPAEEAHNILQLLRELIDSHKMNVPSSSPGACQYTKIPQRKQTR